MAQSFTTATLKAALYAFTEDSGDDFVANIQTVINNGLEMLARDLDLNTFKREETGSFQSGVNEVTRPSDALSIESFYYIDATDGNKRKLILRRSDDFCFNYWPVLTNTGKPKYFSENKDTQILVVPTPEAAYNWRMRVMVRPILNDTITSNWLSDNAGDLLLYACLIHAEKFLMAKGDGRSQEWREEYEKQLPIARREFQSIARKDFSPLLPSAKVEDNR